MALTCDEFLKKLHKAKLPNEQEIRDVLESVSEENRPADGEAMASLLVEQEMLTAFQAQAILRGKGRSLTLGNYVIEDKIGQGGMGMVYRAHHRNMKRSVALKVVNTQVSNNKRLMKRFHREVEAAAKLNHPNIVVAHDADAAQGTWFLVMELVEGKDLSTIVKRNGPVTIPQALDLILQTARGLEYAHEQGVVHRDIKPSNLLLDRSGTVKILDLGLARIEMDTGQSELTSTDAVLGTADFMSPEQAANTKNADARSDVYSLGCTLWFLLTGRNVYGGDTLMAKMWAHHGHSIPSLADLRDDATPELQAIFEKMVAKAPGDRYQSMADLIDDLEKYESGDHDRSVTQSSIRSEASQLLDFLAELDDPGVSATNVTDTRYDEAAELDETCFPADLQSQTVHDKPGRPIRKWGARQVAAVLAAGTVILLVSIVIFSGDRDDGNHAEFVPDSSHAVNTKDAPPPSPAAEPETFTVSATPSPDAEAPFGAQNPFSELEARSLQQSWTEYLGLPVEQENSLGMKMRFIPPGRFQMGSTREEIERVIDEYPDDKNRPGMDAGPEWSPHQVTLNKPFYCSVTELTVEQFAEFVAATGYATDAEKAGNKPRETWKSESQDPNSHRRAAHWISWNDAVAFCRWLSEKEQIEYRLPTEAEWEFACRAGSTSALGREYEDQLGEHAWVKTNADRVMPVGLKQPNPFGLYDQLGNVTEWCQDFFEVYSQEAVADPLVTSPRSREKMRILRGGSFHTPPYNARPPKRGWAVPDFHNFDNGFRVVASIEWNPGRPLVFPLKREITPAMAQTDFGKHRRIEVVKELGQLKINQSPWASKDGRRIYWEGTGDDGEPALSTATRPHPLAEFENRKQLGNISQPKLTADELRVVGMVKGANGPQLAEGVRKSLDEPFVIRPIAELTKEYSPANPFISDDGKILVFQRGGWRRPQIVWCQRRSLKSPWTRPNRTLFSEYLEYPKGMRFTWPCMSAGVGLTLWFTREQNGRPQREIWTAERTGGMAPFRNPQPVLVDGKPLQGTSPFYLTETNEFFFSRPVEGQKDPSEICRIKNFMKRE